MHRGFRPQYEMEGQPVITEFKLSRREAQVFELLAEGLTDKEIANRLNISPSTVKAHVRLIGQKVGRSTRAGIVGKVLRAESFWIDMTRSKSLQPDGPASISAGPSVEGQE